MLKNDAKPRFFSLHRKGLLSLSFLLLILSTAFSTLNYWHLKEQFRAQQRATHAALRAEFKGLIDRAANRLQRLGVVLASLGRLDDLINGTGTTNRLAALTQQFASVRYELDVEEIEVFDREGHIRWNWSPSTGLRIPEQRLQEDLHRVRDTEQPSALLTCQPVCGLHAFVPLLAGGRSIGFIALSQMITDLVLDFSTATGTDIALLVPSAGTPEMSLPLWRLRTAALSSAQRLQPLLKDLSDRYSAPDAIDINKGESLSWAGKDYSIHCLPLNRIMAGETGYILFIADVTAAMSALRRANRDGLMLTVVSLGLAETFLFLLLRRPLRRLERLAATLPLLARGGYREVCDRLRDQGRSRTSGDEIDVLYETSVQLAYQIEENQVLLASEKDFVQGLLDSAQVLILTQTGDGKIHTVNNLVSRVLGRSSGDLRAVRFVDVIEPDGKKEHLENRLEMLFSGSIHRLEHEAALAGTNGGKRHIVWVHTRLGQEHRDDVAVLSVGLDATDRIQAESRSRWLASHDPLTGLANRLRFREELERTFAESVRSGISSALLLFDLDHFKDINDSSGHTAGDALLVFLANVLRMRVRKSDLIARLGGDEFAILMPATGQASAVNLAHDLNSRLTERLFQFGDRDYRISASIGIVLIPEQGKNAEELVANADAAMYQAKKEGGNRWHLFSPTDEELAMVSRRFHWRSVVSQALSEKRLFFYYQPVIDATSGCITYHEALLRVRLEDGRVVLPGEYMDTILRSDLMYAIDCYVTQEALRILVDDEEARLSINLSAAALNDPGWAAPLKRAVDEGLLAPGRLLFEITETAAIADLDAAKRIMNELSEVGFSFAMDDFGTGYASFSYLKQLPVKHVKIDQSFVRRLAHDEGDRVFVNALITLAHGYRQSVVAEGVGDAATLAVLRGLGVDCVQGYYLGEPRPFMIKKDFPLVHKAVTPRDHDEFPTQSIRKVFGHP